MGHTFGRLRTLRKPTVNVISDKPSNGNRSKKPRLKVLLLGACESGKSTLLKQVWLNYSSDYSSDQLRHEKDKIIRQFVDQLLEAVDATLADNEVIEGLELLELVEELRSVYRYGGAQKFIARYQREIKQFWESPVCQVRWKTEWPNYVSESLSYFCESVRRLSEPTYSPTERDYLLCRVRTTGIVQQTIKRGNVEWEIVDVGGARNERRKWINCFNEVAAFIFVAAVSEFNQTLTEDSTVPRQKETLDLFKRVITLKALRDIPVILFLNKVDVLEEKIEYLKQNSVSLNTYFPEIGLGNNYKNAGERILDHIRQQFERVATPRQVHSYFITATNKQSFLQATDSAAKIILRNQSR